MGGLCSIYRSDSSHVGLDAQEFQRTPSKLVNNPHNHNTSAHITNTMASNYDEKANRYDLTDALDIISRIRRGKPTKVHTVLDGSNDDRRFASVQDYEKTRAEFVERDSSLAWDFVCKTNPSEDEKKANEILQVLRKQDEEMFASRDKIKGPGGQEHARFMGDHFLSNVKLIDAESKLFKVAEKMPKGAHLHIHFNANLAPLELINIAKGMDRMFISSNVPLRHDMPYDSEDQSVNLSVDGEKYDNFDLARIQFSILGMERESDLTKGHTTCNLFSKEYPVDKRPPMRFKAFLAEFGKHHRGLTADEWLKGKLVFNEKEAHGRLQTPEGAWNLFNTRTQMMKGLFNYETAYQKYTELCLDEFVKDGIQYAEIRPNFMQENQLWKDNGEEQLDNTCIMNIIIEVCRAFENKHPHFGGIKVIYCTPRSFDRGRVEACLNECLKFKKTYGKWIAGFDLVGEEGKGEPIRTFIPELLRFQENCRAAKVEIPFLFHCGETLDIGGDTDGNLYDALLLGAKRIGHGFALPRHPYVMEQMKKAKVCVELCPISNEILGLTPRANGHSMYNLLANNVHCTVNTDNGTLFKSKLSHDFYQLFAGKKDMTLYGWKQLALWSIEHSCMEDELRVKVLAKWKEEWAKFCRALIKDHGALIRDKASA